MAARSAKVRAVSEVRDNIKEFRKAALHRGAEIHFGERGRDEVTLISSQSLASLKAQAAGMAQRSARSASRPKRIPRQREFIEAMLAAGPIEGPADLSENHDDYLSGRKQ